LIIGILEVRPGTLVYPSWQGPGIHGVQGADEEEEQIALSRTITLPEPIEILDLAEVPGADGR
jgi:hypothetical protein